MEKIWNKMKRCRFLIVAPLGALYINYQLITVFSH